MNFTYKAKHVDISKVLAQFLSAKYTYYSLEAWYEQIESKKILLNGINVEIDSVLKLGDEISFEVTDFEESAVDEKFSIVYEDEFLFAVNKSGNLPVHPAGRYRRNNLTSILLNSRQINSEIFIINRLDRETSGIVLFGKSSLTASKLSKLFESGKIKKTYISYVEGIFPESLSGKGFLGKDETSKIRKKKKFSHEKLFGSLWEVDTDFSLIKSKTGISKIYAYPHTGKIHQIRATLFSVGYPVVGDKIYGYDENLFLKFIETGFVCNKFSIGRQALHAYELEFIHPFTSKLMVIRAEEPKDMCALFQA